MDKSTSVPFYPVRAAARGGDPRRDPARQVGLQVAPDRPAATMVLPPVPGVAMAVTRAVPFFPGTAGPGPGAARRPDWPVRLGLQRWFLHITIMARIGPGNYPGDP